jgi:glycosyltransferase involved in cell wall biosynthesis
LAQVIKKRKIVIVSVLKPVDDTRMFEKMGQTLADTGRYDVHIVGFPGTTTAEYPGIAFHPSHDFKRISLERVRVPFRVLRILLALSPDVIIVTTHELLLAAIIVRIFRKTTVVYDVRENYLRNILFLPTFPALIRPVLALWVRAWEKLLTLFVRRIIASEEGYLSELRFIRRKAVVIQNKVKRIAIQPRSGQSRRGCALLLSGTLAESTGVFTAIHVAGLLHEHDPTVHLTIIGYCAHAETLRRIRAAIEGCDYISLVGGDRLIPHDAIMEAIARADFGFIAYPPNPSTRNTIPTKLFEYLGARLPILLINHPPWMEVCAPYPAALVFDPRHVRADEMLDRMSHTDFYVRVPGEEVFWEQEGARLVQFADELTLE